MKAIFLTPSYRGDLDRFALLRQSIRRFQKAPIQHIVAVPREDEPLFRARLRDDPHVEVVAQQDLVDPLFYPRKWFPLVEAVLGSRSWRLSRFGGRPGWIVQQIIKLSAPELHPEGQVVVVDSDLVFLRPFDLSEFQPPDGSRLLLRQDPVDGAGAHPKYMQKSRELLRLPKGPINHHYMAYPAVWYADWVVELRSHLESLHAKRWQRLLFETNWFSEYLLYGIFVEEVLKPAGLKVRTQPYHHGVWDRAGFERFLGEAHSRVDKKTANAPLTLVVQSNIGMDVQSYEAAIERLIDRNQL